MEKIQKSQAEKKYENSKEISKKQVLDYDFLNIM